MKYIFLVALCCIVNAVMSIAYSNWSPGEQTISSMLVSYFIWKEFNIAIYEHNKPR